jgi:hypothetical protein
LYVPLMKQPDVDVQVLCDVLLVIVQVPAPVQVPEVL